MITACFLFFCWLGQNAVPDGAGGYVPFTNSRVMPDGSLRPYDPAIDGLPGMTPGGPYPSVGPMEEAPAAFPGFVDGPLPPPDYAYPGGYAAPEQAYSPPSSPLPRRHREPQDHTPCYDANGKFVGANNKACR